MPNGLCFKSFGSCSGTSFRVPSRRSRPSSRAFPIQRLDPLVREVSIARVVLQGERRAMGKGTKPRAKVVQMGHDALRGDMATTTTASRGRRRWERVESGRAVSWSERATLERILA